MTAPHLSKASFRDTLAKNNPNMVFSSYSNPVWNVDDEEYYTLDDDELDPKGGDDPRCPTIHLTKEQKHRFCHTRRNALIIKMFEKGVGCSLMQRSPKSKWKLKEEFSFIDIGCDCYITRFSNVDDYRHVLTQEPWLTGDNYLTIRRWVSNFVRYDAPIRFLTAWIRIPNISIEYFDMEFLEMIGSKVG